MLLAYIRSRPAKPVGSEPVQPPYRIGPDTSRQNGRQYAPRTRIGTTDRIVMRLGNVELADDGFLVGPRASIWKVMRGLIGVRLEQWLRGH